VRGVPTAPGFDPTRAGDLLMTPRWTFLAISRWSRRRNRSLSRSSLTSAIAFKAPISASVTRTAASNSLFDLMPNCLAETFNGCQTFF
jgi:hypothetical protein